MRSTSVSFLAFVTVAIAAACGGASTGDLGSGGGGTSSSSSGSGSGSGSSSSSGSGSSGSSSGSASSSSGSVSGSSSGGVPDASMQDVTSVDVVEPMETGPTGPPVLCPQQGQPSNCNQGDICCITGDPNAGTQTDTCQHSGQSCSGTVVRCASSADCPQNQVCCGQKDSTMMMYQEVACRPSCTGTGQVTFCDPAAQTSDCTDPNAPNCVQSTLLPGYNVCGQ